MSELYRRTVDALLRRRTLRRAAAYRELFGPQVQPDGSRRFSPAQQAVLEDLARFGCANDLTFDPDPRAHALKDGRREVWLRIQHFLQLDTQDLSTIRETQDDGYDD